MNIWIFVGKTVFLILILFFLLFIFYSLIEKEKRAYRRNTIVLILLLVIYFLFLLAPVPLRTWLFSLFFVLVAGTILFLLFSQKPKKPTEIVGRMERIDERDIIFARFEYREGTEVFNEYYKRHPEYKKIDDEIRQLPDILLPKHIRKNPVLFSLSAAEFDFLEHLITEVNGEVSQDKFEFSPAQNREMLIKTLKYLGSDFCGICTLNKAYVYSNVGRGPEPYGRQINLDHKYAIAFGLEMDVGMVATAPQAPVIVETAMKYVEAAKISIIIADLIRRLGYPARAHIAGSNYEAILPPVAWEAGLGEMGRLGILITSKYGPRARLGLVTTDLPLETDKPRLWGIQDFCEKCEKCAKNCPAQAIPYGKKKEVNGVLRWTINREECYKYWRKVGTDCATCIFVCPYSKPDNLFHNLIRRMGSFSSAFQSLSVSGDDFFYGRYPLRRKSPL